MRSLPSRKGLENRMAKPTPIGENRLIKQLGADDLAVLQPNLKRVPMQRGTVLHPPARPIEHVYFPLSGMVSLLAVMKNGDLIETGYRRPRRRRRRLDREQRALCIWPGDRSDRRRSPA